MPKDKHGLACSQYLINYKNVETLFSNTDNKSIKIAPLMIGLDLKFIKNL